VLAVLLVQKPGQPPKLYRGTNMEVIDMQFSTFEAYTRAFYPCRYPNWRSDAYCARGVNMIAVS
jgi:hypothetical protein